MQRKRQTACPTGHYDEIRRIQDWRQASDQLRQWVRPAEASSLASASSHVRKFPPQRKLTK